MTPEQKTARDNCIRHAASVQVTVDFRMDGVTCIAYFHSGGPAQLYELISPEGFSIELDPNQGITRDMIDRLEDLRIHGKEPVVSSSA